MEVPDHGRLAHPAHHRRRWPRRRPAGHWSSPPDPGLGASWSARYTDEIILAASSNLNVVAGGTTPQVLIDDRVVTSTTAVAQGTHRIQIDQAGPSTGVELA